MLLGLALLLFPSCGDKKESTQGQSQTVQSDSFTFFDLGQHSKLSKSVRNNLNQRLGRDAVQYRGIIDLEINYYGFLQNYFPSLDELNQRLNFPPGERVEHNTIKLMYRYAQKENVPFDYVELVFSNYTQFPLVFKINFQTDEANILQTLKSKYGEPQLIDWQEKGGQSMYWKKNNDLLIVSLPRDQFGNPEYHIMIYFAENIKKLLDTERKEKEKSEQQRAKSGKKAF